MEITFLGTSSMVPTKDRNHPSVFLKYESEGILFDCGEGTQRQLKIAGISPTEVTKILISHWHGDHVLGLPGFLQTRSGSNYAKELKIFGPKGTKRRVELMFEVFIFDKRADFKANDIRRDKFFEGDGFSLLAKNLEHGVTSLGFVFVEKDKRKMIEKELKKREIPKGPLWGELQKGKTILYKGKKILPNQVTKIIPGKKVAYIIDTRICKNAIELSKNVDLLICEATYAEELEEKSEKHFHLTSSKAAEIARRANAKRLILTHFSQRYKTTQGIKEEAQKTFPEAECAYDFMRVRV